jgi:hypothetical protein
VLVHEAAHIARLDYIAQLVATVACAIYWFNPITWLAASRLRAEAEHAADDRVLAAGVDGVTHASHLLDWRSLAAPRCRRRSPSVWLEAPHDSQRVFTAMLDSQRSRGIVPLRLQAAIGSAAMLVAVPFTSMRLIPVEPKASPITLSEPAPLAVIAPVVTTTSKPVVPEPRQAKPTESTRSFQEADTIVDRTVAASPGETISINLRSVGGVTIRSWNQSQVRVRAILSGTLARRTEVLIARVGGGVEFRTITPEYRGDWIDPNSYEIWVPTRFNVNISSPGGGISINGVEGRFSGNSAGGGITLDNVSGRADLSTGGGEVRVTNSNLEGSVSTGGGRAVVHNTSGRVSVTSGSGPVIRDGGSGVPSMTLAASSEWATAYQERDEINRSFTLPAKARVKVVAINGSVDIKAIDGDTVSVEIERTARSRAELDCNKVVSRQVAGNLFIKSEAVCENRVIQVRHRVLLSLPRNVDLTVIGVSGPVNVGEIEGTISISGNSGNINLAQSGRRSRISGNMGTTTIKLRQLYAGGLELSGNSGPIKLYIGDELNAAVRVSGISGSVSSDLPDVTFHKTAAADYYARIGSGGPTIYVLGNVGNVLLSQYRE